MVLAEIAATLWFLAFGALVKCGRNTGRGTEFEWFATVLLVVVCLALSALVMAQIIIRGLS